MFEAAQQVFFFDVAAGHQFRVAWLGHELPEPGQQQALVAHVLCQEAFEAVKGVMLNLVRVTDRLGVGVGVALFVRQELTEKISEVGQDLSSAGRAKAYRVRHAFVHRDAAVSNARWQVEHVTGLQYPLVGLFEAGKNAQIAVLEQRAVGVAHLPDFPAALAVALEQKHIVVVEMRANSATWGGIADHHIVNAPARQKAEWLQQGGHFRHELVDRLDQQRPLALWQGAECVLGERPATHLPRALAVFQDNARLDFFFQAQTGQFVRADRILEIGEGLTDQQRFFLPVVAQEFVCREAAQELQWNIGFHV